MAPETVTTLPLLPALTVKRCRSAIIRVLLIVFALVGGSCTSLVTTAFIEPAVGNLQRQKDVVLVCEGAPAYLLMIDSLIEANPADRRLLLLGTQSYSGSAAALAACGAAPERIEAISTKARDYGRRLLETLLSRANVRGAGFDRDLAALTAADARSLFWGGYGWLVWIRQQQGSPASMADLIVVEKLMSRVLELDDSVENGSAHLFFGALYGAKPAMVGGDPLRSRHHFEQALALSNRSFLAVQTTYAETYCRMVFDQKTHDALLQEVLDFPLDRAPANILVNQIAKQRARALLDENFFAQ